jgi:hypothetical protein
LEFRQSIAGVVVSPGEMMGNVSINLNFVDNAGGDYHLAGDSPLLGIGRSEPGGIDLDGHVRGAGKSDLGAYEETIFGDGFGP